MGSWRGLGIMIIANVLIIHDILRVLKKILGDLNEDLEVSDEVNNVWQVVMDCDKVLEVQISTMRM